MQPLTTGEYPASMVYNFKRLPKFTEEQSKSLIGSYDFIGINYYTSSYVANKPPTEINPSTDDLATTMQYTETSKDTLITTHNMKIYKLCICSFFF